MIDSPHPQATPPAGDDQPVEPARDPEPIVEEVVGPLASVILDRPAKPDVPSLTLALGGTFVLRCASYAAGLLVAISLGLKSRNEADVTVGYASLVAVTFYVSELFGAPLFGAWSDRIGRKPLMLLGAVLGAIAAQLMGLTMLIPVLVGKILDVSGSFPASFIACTACEALALVSGAFTRETGLRRRPVMVTSSIR